MYNVIYCRKFRRCLVFPEWPLWIDRVRLPLESCETVRSDLRDHLSLYCRLACVCVMSLYLSGFFAGKFHFTFLSVFLKLF